MGRLGQLAKRAARSKGIPVSTKEKLNATLQGLVRIAALSAYETATAKDCALIAQDTLLSVGISLALKKGEVNESEAK